MELHKRFFLEYRALKLFVIGTLWLCIGLMPLKGAHGISYKYLLLWLDVSALFLGMAYLAWRQSHEKGGQNRARTD